MTHQTTAARVFGATFLLTFAALASACNTGGDSHAAASGDVEVNAAVSAGAKADVPSQPAPAKSAAAQLEAGSARGQAQADTTASPVPARAQVPGEVPAAPGRAQLDLTAAQLAEASARLNALANGASVEASAQPGTPSLKVSKGGLNVVDAKVQGGTPSLNVAKAGTLIDANVQAGNPSLNIDGLKASAGAAANTK
ncbi:MAG TPA: hypothetical protein VNN80_26640 [Polyangiaceae bacterium]|nr:hypothetical protein [Polyangiaceae bacterium]